MSEIEEFFNPEDIKKPSDVEAKPEEVEQDSKVEDDETDPDGWVDLLGSGRIRKRILENGNAERGRPKQHCEVDIKLTGN